MAAANNITDLVYLYHLSYNSLDARTQRLFKFLIANPNHTNVDTIFREHHIPWYDQSPSKFLMRWLKIFGWKELRSEDPLKPIFSGRKSYDKAIRKLLQLGLVENIRENDIGVKSTWRTMANPVELLVYIDSLRNQEAYKLMRGNDGVAMVTDPAKFECR